MKRICAWCGKELAEEGSGDPDKHSVTHGICDSCRRVMYSDREIDLQKCLDRFAMPVLAVDTRGNVIAGNNPARERLNQSPRIPRGLLCGDLLACVNASLPGGCWKTVNCPDCEVKQLVEKTYSTGKSQRDIPVLLHRVSEDMEYVIMYLTTEKVADFVLIRIDSLQSHHAA